MSQTYRARLSRYRLEPLHETYKQVVEDFREVPARERLRNPRYVTFCPYCGEDGHLEATIRVGAKKRIEGVILTPTGYEVPERRERSCEILIIDCKKCDAAVDPSAYLAPIAFVEDRRIVDAIVSS